METKKCQKCGESNWIPNGRYTRCKSCLVTYQSKHKETIKQRATLWQKANKDKANAASRKWNKSNKDKRNFYTTSRKARKLLATPKWANDDYIKLWYKLAKIEEKRTGKKVHVDHIVPLKGRNVCGLHCEDNLQLLFAEDNLKKRNR